MGALKIECVCDEEQMNKIIETITKHIATSDNFDISDIDTTIEEFRVCVEFEVYSHKLEINSSEILDSNWDVLPEDTAVLTSRLRPIIDAYNKDLEESVKQALGIRQDQREFIPN